MKIELEILSIFLFCLLISSQEIISQNLEINESEYFESQGINVIVLNDIYPEGHQGGITLIQHGKRVLANGNVALQPTPGQWQPYPRLLKKEVFKENNEIVATMMFPDSNRINSRNQPIIYPDFEFTYKLRVTAEGSKIFFNVDLDEPLPEEWVGKVGFNIEVFPGYYFGKTYWVDGETGILPRYANTPVEIDSDNEFEAVPFAEGKKIVIAPEDPELRITFENNRGNLKLLDGRVKHNNGWFVIRSLIPANTAKNAVQWVITPNVIEDWIYEPLIHISQIGYHPDQKKLAIIELDKNDPEISPVNVFKIESDGSQKNVLTINAKDKERFLRYDYLTADFSGISESGIYIIQYGLSKSNPFRISDDIYQSGVWQPTLEYFLPVQMCHMRVFEKYRVWHDRCHLDDALMAPEDIRHFDGYRHGKIPEGFKPLQHIEGLNKGGWHDAGDYDFRIESQVNTIRTLAYAYEEFDLQHDQTLISQEEMLVEIHHPDGKPDVLQQIEHGLLTVLPGYHKFGKLYRGIIVPTLRQYAILGDAGNMTDGKVFSGDVKGTYTGSWYNQIRTQYDKYFTPQKNEDTEKEFVKDLDDRLVFLEDNPGRQLMSIPGLAAASRVLKGYNDSLSNEALFVAEKLWEKFSSADLQRWEAVKIPAAAELFLTTGNEKYEEFLVENKELVSNAFRFIGWYIARISNLIENSELIEIINKEIIELSEKINKDADENPFGIPYRPHIWGAGWGIQEFGFAQYFLYKAWPEVFSIEPMLNALNFVLGCHPGENTSSFVSNVGVKSQIIAYGINRGDFSFIPGGVVSGTNLVRPDFPEMKDWPFMWQQTEYVIGGGGTNFMFLALAANKLLNE